MARVEAVDVEARHLSPVQSRSRSGSRSRSRSGSGSGSGTRTRNSGLGLRTSSRSSTNRRPTTRGSLLCAAQVVGEAHGP